MSRIRVLQIVPGIAIGDLSGGAELYALQINRLLPQPEFDPAVFVMTRFGSATEDAWCSKLRAEGIAVSGFIPPNPSSIKFLNKVLISLWSFVSSFHPDVLISHTERGDIFNSFIHLFHPIHPKSVRTIHIDKQWITHPTFGTFFNHFIFPITFNAETAVSETIQKQYNNRMIARLLKKETILCHNGIDQSFFEAPPRTAEYQPLPDGIPDAHPRIGIIGRLTGQKGHADLLRAVKIVNENHQMHLLVIGSGPLESELIQITQDMGIEDCVHFLGSRNDVMDILPFLDFLVSASLWEGFPTVLLEAMSQEIPVIATDISGSCELIKTGKTGFLVPPSNPKKLAESMFQMLDNPSKTEEMGKLARQYASQFTIQNTAKIHAALYDSLIDNSG